MVITEKMIQAMMRDIPSELMATELPKHIATVQVIHSTVLSIRRDSAEARAKHDKQQAAYDAEMIRIQEKCPHYVLDFHGDPSGNGDSYQDCSVCGKII